MRLEIHFEAREEFLQAAQFYEAQVPGLGQRFINEIERCQKALLETPLIGQPYGRRLRKFPALFNRVCRSCGGPICISVRSWFASPGLLACADRPLTIGSSDRGPRLR
jgi:hypothetical protein